MPIRTAALIGGFVAACVLARWQGYRMLASLLPSCFLGGMSAWTLWKHYRWGEPQKGVEQNKIIIAVSIITILFVFNSNYIFDWMEGKHD